MMAAAIGAACAGAGCQTGPLLGGGGSALTIESQGESGAQLTGSFDRGVYAFDGPDQVTFVLFEGSDLEESRPTQVAVVRMFWQPQAGATPISSTATNATVQYVVLPGEEQAGVYSGAGFLYPQSRPGKDFMEASLWQADLQLSDRTGGFEDLLGKATAEGEIRARRDEAAVQDLLRQINMEITRRLGYPRTVRAGSSRWMRPGAGRGLSLTLNAADDDHKGRR